MSGDNGGTYAVLSADQILALPDLAVEFVPVPEWGGGVWIRELTGAERDRFEGSLVVGSGKKRRVELADSRARLVQLATIVGPDPEAVARGEAEAPDPATAPRMFSAAQVRALSAKSARALDRVADRIRALSGIGMDAAEVVEELGKDGSG